MVVCYNINAVQLLVCRLILTAGKEVGALLIHYILELTIAVLAELIALFIWAFLHRK